MATDNKTDRQKAYALITYWLNKYKKIYVTPPRGFNRHALAQGFEGLVVDYPHQAEQIIDYYFDVYEDHNATKFIYSYGKIATEIIELEEDEAARREARKRTRERMKNVNSSQGDQISNSQ